MAGRTRPSGGPLHPPSASAAHPDSSRQEFAINSAGIRGMDVTPRELRETGKGMADVANQLMERAAEDGTTLCPVNERGALVEVLLALGVGVEPTVSGAVARHAYLEGPDAPEPVHTTAVNPPRRG